MKGILIVFLVVAIVLSGCVHKKTKFNIRIEGDDWQRDDYLPPRFTLQGKLFLGVQEVPQLYKLERDTYRIDVRVNATKHSLLTSLQISVLGRPLSRQLRVEPFWEGNCGKIGHWGNETVIADQLVTSWGYPFFDDPLAVGFIWYPGTGYCTQGIPQTPEQASAFPIILKIYGDTGLIGEEQIEIEIFQNGYMYYLVTP